MFVCCECGVASVGRRVGSGLLLQMVASWAVKRPCAGSPLCGSLAVNCSRVSLWNIVTLWPTRDSKR